jgi:hypothetical protein
MSVYHVEKSKLPVVVFQADGSVMKGVVFLSASAYSHTGQQSLLDLMRGPGDFFPFCTDAGAFCVANKQTITHIRVDPPTEASTYEPLGEREDVDIKFVGGEQLSGTVTIEGPDGRNRLFDFFNSMKDYFLLQNQEAYYLVNVKQIRNVNPRP